MSDTLQTYAARIERARTGLHDALQGTLRDTTTQAVNEARRLASSRFRARGAALSAITGRVVGLEARLSGDTGLVPWLGIQERGGVIRARAGGFLFLPASNGRPAARVRQVFIRPKHFLSDAMASVVPDFRARAHARVVELVTRGE